MIGSQRHHVAFQRGANLRLESVVGDKVNRSLEHLFEIPLKASKAEQTDVRLEVDEKVDVAVGPVVTTGSAPE